MKHSLDKPYTPKDFEKNLYNFWTKENFFGSTRDSSKEAYTIVIPPPNVTGVLHMGHALNNTLQDILIRYNRMLGKNALWIPGTDHAGIATQNVVEKRLKAEGKSKHDLGREKFIEMTWNVKKEHHKIITEQLKSIGCSCDWSRERFTMDEGLSKAVREVFVDLYNSELIYKGKRIINFCTRCGTALANDEVEYKESNGALYKVRYKIEGKEDKYLEVATTRPETIFADVAIAVNPEDGRYKDIKETDVCILPIVGRKLKIVKDSYVDKEFGTGALKITPAHDINDYNIAIRHNLEIINILNPDGTLNENVPAQYKGKQIGSVVKQVVEELESIEAFGGKENIKHQVGRCYRCDNVVEPYYSDQWFVKMKPLAEKAYKAVNDGQIKMYPERWINTYNHWLTNIQDWCISRQLWWGHRVPVWYCDDCNNIEASKTGLQTCSKCGSKNIRQDEDVLDTWFSSWLWPFSTLDWPSKNEDLKYYYPTTTLVTGYDIIFFWVARMIMAGMHFMDNIPFKNVYLNGLIRDKIGIKMSKSLGNGIDPIEIINEHGADALRFTLAHLTTYNGQDIRLDKELFKMGAKFANKIYNSAKFIMNNIEDGETFLPLESYTDSFEDKDKWILSRLQKTISDIRDSLDGYRFDESSQRIYQFYWNDFCDWYIELSKFDLSSEDKNNIKRKRTLSVLLYVLENSLLLLHPFMPFITEEIYQNILNANLSKNGITTPVGSKNKSLMITTYPTVDKKLVNEAIEKDFNTTQEIISAIRSVRQIFNLSPTKKLDCVIHYSSESFKNVITKYEDVIKSLALTESFKIVEGGERDKGAFFKIFEGGEVSVLLKDIINVEEEKKRLNKEKAELEKNLQAVKQKLSNENFVSRAAPEAIETEQRKEREFSEKLNSVNNLLTAL